MKSRINNLTIATEFKPKSKLAYCPNSEGVTLNEEDDKYEYQKQCPRLQNNKSVKFYPNKMQNLTLVISLIFNSKFASTIINIKTKNYLRNKYTPILGRKHFLNVPLDG